MKRLISLTVVLVAALAGTAAAGPFDPSSYPGPGGTEWSAPPPPDTPALVGGGQAVCTLQYCRYTVSCVAIPGSGSEPCLLHLALEASGQGIITRPTEHVIDEDTGELRQPWPVTEGHVIPVGTSKELVLRVIPPSKKFFREKASQGKKRIRGHWYANRHRWIPTSYPNPPDFLFQYDRTINIKIKVKAKGK